MLGYKATDMESEIEKLVESLKENNRSTALALNIKHRR